MCRKLEPVGKDSVPSRTAWWVGRPGLGPAVDGDTSSQLKPWCSGTQSRQRRGQDDGTRTKVEHEAPGSTEALSLGGENGGFIYLMKG
jgi:hypothetical protein